MGFRAGLAGIVIAMLALPGLLPGSASATVPDAHRYPTAIRHVVVIVFENAELSTVLSQGPFFAYLAAHYSLATHDYAICHPSAPNYLALTSGATYSQCGSDKRHVYNATNIADVVERAGLSWGAYMESMPTRCDASSSYPYAVKHDPFLFYQDIAGNASRCRAHVGNLTAFSHAVAAGSVPNYAFVTPNLTDDGHDTNVSFASGWLHQFLTPLINRTSFTSTAYLVVFDEGTTRLGGGTSSAGPTNRTGGGRIYLSAVSPLSVGVGNVTNDSTPYTVLTTVEWLLGLGSTGHQDTTASWPALRSAFG